jgi:hypothetical protein
MDLDRLLSSRGAVSVRHSVRVCHQEHRTYTLTIITKSHLLPQLSSPAPRTQGYPIQNPGKGGLLGDRLVSVHLVGNGTRGTLLDLRANLMSLQSRLLLRLLLHSCARNAPLFFHQNIWMKDPLDHSPDREILPVIPQSRRCQAISKIRSVSTRSSGEINGRDVHDPPYSKTWFLYRSKPGARSGSRP